MNNAMPLFKPGDNLHAIDALRGYAILLVLTAHSVTSNVVWPAKRVMLMGVYGVQLFFIASAVTLLMSWSRSTQPFGQKNGRFFLHRFFRIAPLYFLAIVFYWFVDNRTPADFSMARLVSSVLFLNNWNPHLLPTTGGWIPVPGGWSISVEFCFYFIFPLLAIVITNMRTALGFVMASFAILIISTHYGQTLYPEISADERSRFLFFWFPNQLIVFAIGFVLYQCLQSANITALVAKSRVSPVMASIAMLVALILLSYTGMAKTGIAPTHLSMAIAFAIWALFLLIRPDRLVVNPIIIAIGKVSFSVYIIHFAVIIFVRYGMTKWWPFNKEGIFSLLYVMISILLALGISYAIAVLTYRYVEKPGVNFGKSIALRLFPSQHKTGSP